MLFTSYSFIAFMAVVLLAYYLLPKKWQWPLLLVASCFFYWCANPMYLLFIGVTIVSTYGVSRLLEQVNDRQKAYLAEHKATLSKEEKKALDALQRGQKTSRSVTLGNLFALIGAFVPTPILSKLTGSVVQLLKDSYVVCIYNGQQITMADFTRNAAFAVLMIIGALLGIATALLCNWGFRSKVTSWAYLILYALVAVGLIQQKTIGVVLGPVLWWTLAVLGLCAVITTLTVYYKKKKPMIAFLVSISLLTAVIAIV